MAKQTLVYLIIAVILLGCEPAVEHISYDTTTVVESSFLQIDLISGNYSVTLANGEVLNFSLYVPGNEVTSNAFVIALHYAGGNGADFMNFLVKPAFSGEDAIIFSPNSTNWTSIYIMFVLKSFTDLAIRHWPVDSNRIVVTGYSNGGFGTWTLTNSFPELFSAGIPMAATPILAPNTGEVPLFVIHGENDELFNIEDTQFVVDGLIEQGATIEFLRVPGRSHYEANLYVDPLKQAVSWLKLNIWKEKRQ